MRVRDAIKNIGHILYWGMQVAVLWTLLTLLSRYSQLQQSALQPAALPVPEATEHVERPLPQPQEPARLLDLAAADRLFRERRWKEALDAYEQIAELASKGVRVTALYRAALCLEALGDYPGADRRYSELRASVTVPLPATILLVSQARCWLRMGLTDRAIRAATDVLIQQAADLGDHDALHEARYILALAVGLVGGDRAEQGTELRPARVHFDWVPEYALRWIEPVLLLDGDDVNGAVEEKIEVTRVAPEVTDLRIDVYLRSIDALRLLEQTAQQGGIELELEPGVSDLLKGEAFRVHVSGLLYSHLLTYLAARYGLVWEARDGAVQLALAEHMAPPARQSWHANLTERLVRDANVWLPDHPALSIAYVQLGLLRHRQRDTDGARDAYSAAIREATDKGAVLAAHYNLALVAVEEQHFSEAVPHLYGVVDAAPGTELAARAHLLLGRLHLLRGNTPNGVTECRRALLNAVDPQQRGLAVLWTACAYLLDENPAAAGELLREYRGDFVTGPQQAVARFLDAFAAFQGGNRDEQLKAELLSGAIVASSTNLLGTPGVFLIGDALYRLGLEDLMRDVYEKHVDRLMPGALREQILERLVQYYHQRGNYQAALRHLLAQSARSDPNRLLQTRIRQIELQIGNKQYAVALQLCREVLREIKQTEQVRTVLALMGQAYEAMGDYKRAAMCYGGRIPLE